MIDFREVLEDIAMDRGVCSECGKLADKKTNCVGCDVADGRPCRWSPRDPQEVARAALEDGGK